LQFFSDLIEIEFNVQKVSAMSVM